MGDYKCSSVPCFAERELSQYYRNINTSVLRLTSKSHWVKTKHSTKIAQWSRGKVRYKDREKEEWVRERARRQTEVIFPFPPFSTHSPYSTGKSYRNINTAKRQIITKAPFIAGSKADILELSCRGMANTFLELFSVLHSLTNIKQDNKIHR